MPGLIQSEPRKPLGTSKRFWWVAAVLVIAVALISHHWHRSSRNLPSRESIEAGRFPVVPDRMPPWEARPDNSPPVAKGYIPAWKIDSPRGDPNARPAPLPVAPPNPAEHRPPMENPGGVNGDRPPRAVPTTSPTQ